MGLYDRLARKPESRSRLISASRRFGLGFACLAGPVFFLTLALHARRLIVHVALGLGEHTILLNFAGKALQGDIK